MFIIYTFNGELYISSEQVYKYREENAREYNLEIEYIKRTDNSDDFYYYDNL